LGMAALSGRVVDHETGYRSAQADVLALAVINSANLLTTDNPCDIDDIFVSTRQEIRQRCTAEAFALEKAVEYLEKQARRYDQMHIGKQLRVIIVEPETVERSGNETVDHRGAREERPVGPKPIRPTTEETPTRALASRHR